MKCPLDADEIHGRVTPNGTPKGQIPVAEMERMMKVREVILKAMAGSLKWWEAAEIIGATDRTMRRCRDRYQEHGYDGLYDRRKGQPGPNRIAIAQVANVLRLYRDK